MKRIKFDCNISCSPAYGCSEPGDNSGWYVQATDYDALVERLEAFVTEMKQQPAAYLSPRWAEALQQIIDEHALARKNG